MNIDIDAVGLLIAFWGAVTGSIALTLSLVTFFTERPRLDLKWLRNFVVTELGMDGRMRHTDERYARLMVTNLGRQEIRVAGAHGAKENDDGSIGLFKFSDGLVDSSKNRVVSPSEPSTEYHVKESDELNSFLFVAVTDGFGKSHIKWLVPRPRRWWLKWRIRSLLRN